MIIAVNTDKDVAACDCLSLVVCGDKKRFAFSTNI